jgi:hypothetical protein
LNTYDGTGHVIARPVKPSALVPGRTGTAERDGVTRPSRAEVTTGVQPEVETFGLVLGLPEGPPEDSPGAAAFASNMDPQDVLPLASQHATSQAKPAVTSRDSRAATVIHANCRTFRHKY